MWASDSYLQRLNNIVSFLNGRVESSVLLFRPIFFQLTVYEKVDIALDNRRGYHDNKTFAESTNTLSEFSTKRAVWNNELGCWQHNLGARVKCPSNNNFVLIKSADDGSVANVEQQSTFNTSQKVCIRHGKVI